MRKHVGRTGTALLKTSIDKFLGHPLNPPDPLALLPRQSAMLGMVVNLILQAKPIVNEDGLDAF